MLDLKMIRTEPDKVKAAIQKREMNLDSVIDEILKIDVDRRAVTGKVEEFDANPTPLASIIDQPTEEKYMEVLKQSKVFNQAFSDPEEGLLTWEDLFSYPPFVGFFNNFTAAYQEIEDDFKA